MNRQPCLKHCASLKKISTSFPPNPAPFDADKVEIDSSVVLVGLVLKLKVLLVHHFLI